MSTLTIPRLSERTHARLLRRAAENGRSVEAEVRAILDAAVGLPDESTPMAPRVFRGRRRGHRTARSHRPAAGCHILVIIAGTNIVSELHETGT